MRHVMEIVLSILATLSLGLCGGLLLDALPSMALWLVRRAARRTLPIKRAAYEEDWVATMADMETKFGKMRWALECWWASLKLEPPFTLQYWRVRLAMQRYLMTNAANGIWLYRRALYRYPLSSRRRALLQSLLSRRIRAVLVTQSPYIRSLTSVCVRQQATRSPVDIVREEVMRVHEALTLDGRRAYGEVFQAFIEDHTTRADV